MSGELKRRAWVEVDLDALKYNIEQIRRHIGPKSLMAVVKADAYGHGAVLVGQTAIECGARYLGVATLEEGVQLREAGLNCPIVVLGAINTPDEVQTVLDWNLQPTLCTPKQVLTCAESLTHSHPVHLKIDTGMGRLGAPWLEAVDFVRLARAMPRLQVESVYSHLATADEPASEVLNQQYLRFVAVLDALKVAGIAPPLTHLANSAAALRNPELHYDMVRVGGAMYGLYPAPCFKDLLDLRPVMQVRARITQLKTVPAHSGVSYGHLYRTDSPTRLATVAIGYADGVPRNLSGRLEAIVRGKRVPQVGAITMDQLILDVSSMPEVCETEIVTFLGQDGEEMIGAEVWAQALGTIHYEVVCGFKHRLPRVVHQSSPVGQLQ